jgi:hypothetical protein
VSVHRKSGVPKSSQSESSGKGGRESTSSAAHDHICRAIQRARTIPPKQVRGELGDRVLESYSRITSITARAPAKECT